MEQLTKHSAISSQTAMILVAVGQAIRDATKESPLGGIPSGHLYAAMTQLVSLHEFTSIINVLKRTKLVKEQYNLLTWIGDLPPTTSPAPPEAA